MIQDINQRLISHNVVKQLNIEINPFTFYYDLILLLAESEALFADEIQLKFEDVSQLDLSNFGGGLMQFMHLTITKLNLGLERQKYEIKELEDDKIQFKCFKIEMFD